MRPLFYSALLAVVFQVLFSGFAAAQQRDILYDVSGSTNNPIGFLLRNELKQLGDEFVTVIPWSDNLRSPLYGSGADIARAVRLTGGATKLGASLTSYRGQGVICREIIIMVHGLADDMVAAKEETKHLLEQRNQVVILVVVPAGAVADDHRGYTEKPSLSPSKAVVGEYRSFSESPDLMVLELLPGMLPLVYQSEPEIEGCVLNTG